MNRRSYVLSLALLTFFPAADAFACGDKFLLLGRSIRYEEAYAAKHPASVFVDANPATGFSAVAGEVAEILRKAGHKPVLAESRAGRSSALKSEAFDVVFTDWADIEAVSAAVAEVGSKAIVLGVVYNPTGKELEAAEKRYNCILTAKGKNKHFLGVVNEVMRLRAKGREPVCGKD